MVYREGRSRIDVAREEWARAREAEATAASAKGDAQAELARAEAALSLAWAEHGAATALERHLAALIRAGERVSREAEAEPLGEDLSAAQRRAESARAKIGEAEAAVAAARTRLEAALDELTLRTKTRMEAESELEKLDASEPE
jgi:hypothetical protein